MSKHRTRRLAGLILAWLALWALPGSAEDREVVIGQLSFLPAEQTQARALPTAQWLESRIPGYRFTFRALGFEALEQAVRDGEVDFVLTNPEHHVYLARTYGVTDFATLVNEVNGLPLDRFGGVVFTRAEDPDHRELADVVGARVAAVSEQSLGGFLAQAGVFDHLGIDLAAEAGRIHMTGMPHANVVSMVLAGEADFGLVRSGVLEDMVRRGALDLADIHVIDDYRAPGDFPFLLSTPLYPEWPFGAMSSVPDELVKQVAVALFQIGPEDAAADQGGYHGFKPPADYGTVDALMERLRVGPYARAERFDWGDIYQKYSAHLISAMGAALFGVLLLAWYVLRANGRLNRVVHAEQALAGQLRELNSDLEYRIHEHEEAQRALRRSEKRLSLLFASMEDHVFVVDRRGRFTEFFQSEGEDRLVDDPSECLGRPMESLFPYRVSAALDRAIEALDSGARTHSEEYSLQVGNQSRWFMARFSAVHDPERDEPAYLVVMRDMTERKRIEERLRLDASVFHHAHEGILVTDATGQIVEANATFCHMTGYERDEVIGRNPRFLQSGRQDGEFYRRMWSTLLERGAWHGELWNRKKNGDIYAQLAHISAVRDDRGRLTHFVGLFSDITPIKETEHQLKSMAYHDALTRLPNRSLLSERMRDAMAQTRAQGGQLVVAYMDLDGFKPVNDSLGHDKGDQLLRQVADRLRKCVRGMDTVARLGGDEFVVLLTEIQDQTQWTRALDRLLQSVNAPYELDGKEVRVSASVGVTLFPDDDADADTLMRHSDQAMYRAKQEGRNRYHLFDPEHDRRAQEQSVALERIAAGLSDGEFVLYYQPKVDMTSGQVAGAEALIRWQHPERGLVPPGEFLPMVEDSDLSADLGVWVIREALRQWAAWHADGLTLPLSVNVSAHHLESPDFATRLAELLSEVPEYQAGMLDLEILETAALLDVERICGLIHECAGMGVLFSLDDFGTGYSSLTYLKRLPAQTLKIDQSFVRDMLDDPEDRAIVEGVVGLARAFDRCVIAEGAETPEHCRLLRSLGCFMAQGYGIARPMPAASLAGWVRDFRPDPQWQDVNRGKPGRG
ncbi:MAG: EAL domain-containing protein [Halothiobacillaceae bacterium]